MSEVIGDDAVGVAVDEGGDVAKQPMTSSSTSNDDVHDDDEN